MPIENNQEEISFCDFHQRPSVEQSTDNNLLRRPSLTNTPKRRTSKVHFVLNPGVGMLMSSSRQEFIPGDSNGGVIEYGRKGGCFINKCGIFTIIIVILLIAIATGTLVYFFAPCRSEGNNDINEVLSWTVENLNIRTSSTPIKLNDDVKPNFYRLMIKSNFTSFTFDGTVLITLSTKKANVNFITLHAKDLQILNETVLIEQQITPVPSASPLRFRRYKRETESENVEDNSDNTISIDEDKSFESGSNETKPVNATESTIDNNKQLTNDEKPFVNQSAIATNSKSITINSSLDDIIPTDETLIKKLLNSTTKKPSLFMQSYNEKQNLPKNFIPQKNNLVLQQAKRQKILIVSQTYDASLEMLKIKLESNLKPGLNYTLEIKFKGNMDESLHGFYRGTYKDSENNSKVFAVTQFEPNSARKAFPCFDEPEFKARFEISIARPKNMSVISNMKLSEEEEDIEDNNTMWSHFEKSLPMSTYLVAYVISEFESKDVILPANTTDTSNVTFKIWTRKELLNKTTYTAEVTPKLLNFFEKYFEIPHMLSKIDLIGIPNFAVGGMENWGAITIDELLLIVNSQSKTPKSKRAVATIIAHELAHQWFGNMVTMRWWNDIWLNEGFATYMQYISVQTVEPQWQFFEQFDIDKMLIMNIDSLQAMHPVSDSIEDESQIGQVFDDIIYMKGASLLRMLSHVLTEKVFRSGLYEYLNKWKFSNADQNDFYDAISSVYNKSVPRNNFSVSNFMNSWILEAGYPIINVKRNYEKGTVFISQKKFSLHENWKSDALWYVPITYAVGNTSYDTWKTTPVGWLEKVPNITLTLPETANSTWMYVNVLSIGYYRVNYDYKNWKSLEYGLYDDPSQFPVVTRAQLLDDAFHLAKGGELNYTIPLDLTKYMIDTEVDYVPWLTVLNDLNYLHRGLQRSDHFNLFQEYISRLIMPTLTTLGFTPREDDTIHDATLRNQLMYWACLVEEDKCLEWATKHFNNWMESNDSDKQNPVPFDNRGIIYSTIIRKGSKKEFDFLMSRLENSNDPETKTIILISLSSTKITWQINYLLNYSMTLEPQMAAYFWSGFESDTATQAAFNYVLKNWNNIYGKFGQMSNSILSSLINCAFGNIYTEQELRQFKLFIQDHKEELSSVSKDIQKNVENAVIAIEWGKTKVQDIEMWLIKFAETKELLNDYITLYVNSSHQADHDQNKNSNIRSKSETDKNPSQHTVHNVNSNSHKTLSLSHNINTFNDSTATTIHENESHLSRFIEKNDTSANDTSNFIKIPDQTINKNSSHQVISNNKNGLNGNFDSTVKENSSQTNFAKNDDSNEGSNSQIHEDPSSSFFG